MLEELRRELFRCQARALWLRSLAVSDPLLSARLQAESSLAFLRATQGECPLDSLSGHPEAASDISESGGSALDRKSTRLNSSHSQISYAVFCLKKKSTDAAPPSAR